MTSTYKSYKTWQRRYIYHKYISLKIMPQKMPSNNWYNCREQNRNQQLNLETLVHPRGHTVMGCQGPPSGLGHPFLQLPVWEYLPGNCPGWRELPLSGHTFSPGAVHFQWYSLQGFKDLAPLPQLAISQRAILVWVPCRIKWGLCCNCTAVQLFPPPTLPSRYHFLIGVFLENTIQ